MIGPIGLLKKVAVFPRFVAGCIADAAQMRDAPRQAYTLAWKRSRWLRLRWLHWLHGDRVPGPLTLDGRAIHFLNYPIFLSLWKEIVTEECYRPDTPRPAQRILDCGGNIGMASIYFRRLFPEARIVVFEPVAEHVDCLRRNLGDDPRVELLPYALAARPGRMSMSPGPVGGGVMASATVYADTGKGAPAFEVECRPLSDWLREPADILKMDIEGGEREVLGEVDEKGLLPNIGLLLLEYHYGSTAEPDAFCRLMTRLGAAGFEIEFRAHARLPGEPMRQTLVIAARNRAYRGAAPC